MRTIFEDVIEKSNKDDDRKGRGFTLALWLVALLSMGGAYGAYHFIKNRKPEVPPPPPVSVEDDSQVSRAINQFNGFVQVGNWEEAQKMLSREGQSRLVEEKLTLRESLLGDKKNAQLAQALLTPSQAHTPSTARIDCAYIFIDGSNKIVPITVVLEDGRLLVNSW
jgi:hypothetical protein